MTRPSGAPLRALTDEERDTLKAVTRSRSEAAEVVGRAKSLIAVADGADFAAGARAGGRKSGYGVGKLVRRFNQAGLQALLTKPGCGRKATYTPDLRAKVLEEFPRTPDTCTTVRCVSRTGWQRNLVVDAAAAGAPPTARVRKDQPGDDQCGPAWGRADLAAGSDMV